MIGLLQGVSIALLIILSFASLKEFYRSSYLKIPMIFLTVFALCNFPLSNLWASQDGLSLAEMDLEPIVVTPGRQRQSSAHIGDDHTVVTSDMLKHWSVKNLGEALMYVPGVEVTSNGPFGQASSVSIRGSASRQVLVVVDGIPFNNQLSGQANLSRIPVDDIERIEVIKGGSSSQWGSSLGGVIQVITKSPGLGDKTKVQLKSSYGSFAAFKESALLSGQKGKWAYLQMANWLHAGGHLADSRTQEIKTLSKLSYELSPEWTWWSSFGYSGAQLRYGPTSTRRIFDQPYISRYGQTGLRMQDDGHEASLIYQSNDQDIHSLTKNSSTSQIISSTTSHNMYHGFLLHHAFDLRENLRWSQGLDQQWHELKSNRYLTKSISMNETAPYTQVNWRIGPWDIIPSLRYDHNSHYGSQLSPSLATILSFGEKSEWHLRSKAGRAFNAPPLLWRYNDDPGFLVGPNPTLKAERAYIYELGLDAPLGPKGLKSEISLFRHDVYDAISIIDNGVVFESRNFNKYIRQGIEGGLDYHWQDQLYLYAHSQWIDVRNVKDDVRVRDAGSIRHGFKWGARYHFLQETLSCTGMYQRYNATADDPANDRKPIWDVMWEHSWPLANKSIEWRSFLSVKNVSNSSYYSDPLFPWPGRSYEVGMSVDF